MKRKRGNKKAKRKGNIQIPKENVSSIITQDQEDNSESAMELELELEVGTPSSTGTDVAAAANNPIQIENENEIEIENAKGGGSSGKSSIGGGGVGRVKVKLKNSLPTHLLLNSSTQTQSDNEKMEDSANSFPIITDKDATTSSKKPGIKIKSSKSSFSFPPSNVLTSTTTPLPHNQPFHNKDLDSALIVIKKIMKMDAAEPFNVPVNPVALGIPDYFDVIDTPMDFGTICTNLENGLKYMNSGDVFKDVQYIWENCYKYNNKGDYILDLMRRVKKNFSKYWTAAGLYNGQLTDTNGIESFQENGGTSSQIKLPLKGGQSKQKAGKRHGRRHKSDCLCAVCVLKRRRKEREEIARIANAKDQIGVDNNPSQEFKAEESQHVESLCSEDSSSNADDSLDNELDVEEGMGDETKMEVSEARFSTPEEKQEQEEGDGGNEMELKTGGDDKGSEQYERLREDPSRPSKPTSMEQSADVKVEDVLRNEEGQQAIHQPQQKELQEKRKKMVKVWEELNSKNPMVMELCGILFPVNPTSVWRGPNSLLQQPQKTSCVSSIHKAIDKFIK